MYNPNQMKNDLDTIFYHRAQYTQYGFYRLPMVKFGKETIAKVYGEFQRLRGLQFEPFTTLEMDDPLTLAILKEAMEYD